MIMRINVWALALAALFVLFAFVQLNDADPWPWFALYMLVAALLVASALGYYRAWAIYAGLAVIAIWMVSILPEFIRWVRMGMPSITGKMKATEPHIEYAREFLGLLLSGITLGWMLWKRPSSAKK
jgi:hypothetical protein